MNSVFANYHDIVVMVVESVVNVFAELKMVIR